MRLLPFLLLIGCGGSIVETASEVETLRHDVEYEIQDGVARLWVRRAFRSVATPELELSIALPTAGSLDRFRFGFNDRWYDGELLEASAAAERYDLLSGIAGIEGHAIEGAPPPALLAYVDRGQLVMRARPIAPEDTIEIEYRILIPTCHADGRPFFDYPFDPIDPPSFAGPGQLREPAEEDDFASACDPDATLATDEHVVIELDPLPELALTYAVQPLLETTAVRIAIDAPAELAPIPQSASIVFVVDGSYSQADVGLADQLAWARAYLQWVPDAQVEVIVFRREAERLFGRFLPARDFGAAIEALPAESRALGNGSFLDRGLALASSILAGAGGETRIVATSDLRLRTAFDAEAVSRELSPSIVHLLMREPADGEPHLSIDSTHELAVIPHATGGLFASLEGDPTQKEAIDAAEELVHPIRLHQIQLIGLEEVSYDTELVRGHRVRTTAFLERVPPYRIEVRANLWSSPRSFDLPRSSVVDDAMPAILIATAPSLSQSDEQHLGELGGVVSSMTSYLAERGGVDPLPPADQIGEVFGLGGFGISGTSCGCGCGGYGVSIGIGDFWLQQRVRELANGCGASEVSVEIETTLNEIADVTVTATEGEECLREAIWSLQLDEAYGNMARTHFSISL